MIEGDIGLRGMNTEKRQMVAVMMQPPATDSDLTFDEWLDAVKGSGKGIKLDFMHIESVELALQMLQSNEKEVMTCFVFNVRYSIFNYPNLIHVLQHIVKF